jgi:small conductance mechanosensitive channel
MAVNLPVLKSNALLSFLLIVLLAGCSLSLRAQDVSAGDSSPEDQDTRAPVQVDVTPAAEDEQIRDRLSGILSATGWFTDTEVDVNEGVVFLRGTTDSGEYKRWAGDLARNTQDVAAVVNQIVVTEPDIWDYEPAFTGVRDLWHSIMRALPFWIFGIVVLILFWGISTLTAGAMRAYLRNGKLNPLLQDITAKTVAVIVFLLGIYVVFHVADLTNVALTVLGGTGLLGIILGIAFRDITENFLASIFLSLQNPFHAGDFVDINGSAGIVQRLTIRATILMTLDGNHMQIPNSVVFKSVILNYTSNPNQRTQFVIGIGYDTSITTAQDIGSKILADHPAVLSEPEPWVLVDELAASTINMKFYFWVDGSMHNILKVKSSVLRLVKSAYQKHRISMPDESREMVFPEGVTIQMNEKEDRRGETSGSGKPALKPEITGKPDDTEVSTSSEGRLQSNVEEIREQARRSRPPEEGEDLLKPR